MSYAPPPMNAPAYGSPAPTRTSGAAVTSLITGVLGCLVLTAFVAIATGLMGIRATRDPAVKGRGLAIAGLILGILWLGFAVVGTVGGVALWRNSEAPAVVARQFTADLAAANYAACLRDSSGMTEAELTTLHDTIAPWGSVTDVALPIRGVKADAGAATRWELSGTAKFATGGARPVSYVLHAKPAGGYQVVGVEFK